MKDNLKIYIESLGCAKNLVDSEVMTGCLLKAGYNFTDIAEEAGIIIINTCAFVQSAVKEAVDTILHAGENKTAGGTCKHLIVCGCLVQRYKEELIDELYEVDLFLGAAEYPHIAKHIKKLISQKNKRIYADNPAFLIDCNTPRILSSAGASAYIKIAEGCSHRCTYCAIPAIKGEYRQRTVDSVMREARKLAANGISELNLISQDTARFAGIGDLLSRLAKLRDLHWIRLLYCHPKNLSHELIDLMCREEKICKYIDMPLQHISDKILKRMGRKITSRETYKLIDYIKSRQKKIALRTTFIVGFPGETDADFEKLYEFVKQTQFDHVGVFEYTDEDVASASRFADKVPDKIKKLRRNELMKLQMQISKNNNKDFVGKEIEVLIENIALDERYALQARSQYQAPDVDGVVYLNEDLPIGEFVKVKITKSLTYDLVAKSLKNKTNH